MKYHLNKIKINSGLSLIEMVIFISLISVLLSGFISFVYEINTHLLDLNNNINDAENM